MIFKLVLVGETVLWGKDDHQSDGEQGLIHQAFTFIEIKRKMENPRNFLTVNLGVLSVR